MSTSKYPEELWDENGTKIEEIAELTICQSLREFVTIGDRLYQKDHWKNDKFCKSFNFKKISFNTQPFELYIDVLEFTKSKKRFDKLSMSLQKELLKFLSSLKKEIKNNEKKLKQTSKETLDKKIISAEQIILKNYENQLRDTGAK